MKEPTPAEIEQYIADTLLFGIVDFYGKREYPSQKTKPTEKEARQALAKILRSGDVPRHFLMALADHIDPDSHRYRRIEFKNISQGHYTAEDKARIIAQYPDHERDTRTRGIPQMGSGRVFLVDIEKLFVDPFECPRHWVRVGGMDFGWTHYAAFCECWWDRDLDIFYLVRTIRMREKTPIQHVQEVKRWRLRWAWPHERTATDARRSWRAADEAIRRRWSRYDA